MHPVLSTDEMTWYLEFALKYSGRKEKNRGGISLKWELENVDNYFSWMMSTRGELYQSL